MTGPAADVVDVTVVIPVYNTMPYLRACLDSMVSQTIGPGRLQVVAVDDGSTDGSGDLLDEYAARHPEIFTVIHQQNSGGPAGPCNVGLDHAVGRYVFFLGSDDYLGDEALARMVAKADEWESDVVCARLVGEGGRWVNQRLFADTARDVPFPSTLLASALSNTKLFRRSLVEEHGLRFPHRKVASDQPFTISAMHFARRVSVLADYAYYHAVKRDEATNITYSSTWRMRLDGIAAVVRHVADLIPPGDGRDAILQRHFRGEIATLLRRDLAELEVAGRADEQAELVTAVAALVEEFLTAGIAPHLRVVDRIRYALVRLGDLDTLRSLVGQEDLSQPLVVTADQVRVVPPDLADRFPSEVYVAEPRDAARLLHDATTWSRVAWEDGDVVVAGEVRARFEDEPRLELSLVRSREGGSRPPVVVPAAKQRGALTVAADLVRTEDRCLVSARLGVSPLAAAGKTGPWAVRLRVLVGEDALGLPVTTTPETPATETGFAAGGAAYEGWLGPDRQGRTVVAVHRAAEEQTTQRQRWRWSRRG